MRMDEMIIIISRIRFAHLFMNENVSGHRIAKMLMFTYSRATTYRKLKKMENIGLIRYADTGNSKEWILTIEGLAFWENYNELPF